MFMSNVGISAEFVVAAELARRDFAIGITFGNTKKLDLIAEKNGKAFMIQVKGVSHKNSGFRIKPENIENKFWYILVNINSRDTSLPLEFAILKGREMRSNLRVDLNQSNNAVPITILKNKKFKNAWKRLK